MKEPIWVTKEVVLAVHEELLARYGGLSGLRDSGLLDSALNRPLHMRAYGSPDCFDLAAAYAGGIIRDHPFLDGKKRSGFMTAYTFLGANGIDVVASEEDVVLQTLALAAGELDETGYAAWLRGSCKPVSRRRRPG